MHCFTLSCIAQMSTMSKAKCEAVETPSFTHVFLGSLDQEVGAVTSAQDQNVRLAMPAV